MRLAIFIAAVAVLAAHADTPKNEPPAISVVGTTQQNLPDVERAKMAFDFAQSVLGGRRRLPHLHITLIYVDRETANAQGIPKRADVFMVHMLDTDPPVYFQWIVGDPDDNHLAMACVMLLNRQWELKLQKPELDEAVNRVRLGLAGVISARDLARQTTIKAER